MASAFPDLAPYVHPSRVVFLPGMPSKRETLIALVDQLAALPGIGNRAAFMQAILDREDVTSTGIGGGVAVPHAQLSTITIFAIAIAVCPSGIEFAAKDDKPVRVVVMIAAPSRDRPAYLKILASVAARLNRSDLVARLLEAKDGQDVIARFLG